MRSLPDNLSAAAFALAMGIEGCAPVTPQPKPPEVIVVEIPAAMAIENYAEQDEPPPRRRENQRTEIERPLTVKRILAKAPSRSVDAINAEVETYESLVVPDKKTGSEVISQCLQTRRALECSALRWEEQHRAILGNTDSFLECTDNSQDDDEWFGCMKEKLHADSQLSIVRAYCSQLVLECIQAEFSK